MLKGNTENSRRRRDRVRIMAEMLEAAQQGSLKTQLMYRANLSFSQLIEYLTLLVDLGLLEIIDSNERTIYKTTNKGLRYLQSYNEICELLRQ